MRHSAEFWLEALHGLGLRRPVRIMNVCGGHERAISLAGLRSAIPDNIELVPGPGCPVARKKTFIRQFRSPSMKM